MTVLLTSQQRHNMKKMNNKEEFYTHRQVSKERQHTIYFQEQ